jgi:hypothetical protein
MTVNQFKSSSIDWMELEDYETYTELKMKKQSQIGSSLQTLTICQIKICRKLKYPKIFGIKSKLK